MLIELEEVSRRSAIPIPLTKFLSERKSAGYTVTDYGMHQGGVDQPYIYPLLRSFTQGHQLW